LRRRFRRERPLVEIYNIVKLEAWLHTQPREVSATFAVRAALRVLPLVWTARDEGSKGDLFADIVLPVFRATAVAWVMARYPGRQLLLRATGAAAVASASIPRTAAPFVVIAATSAATAANSPTLASAAASAACGADAAARAAYAEFGKGFSLGFNLTLSTALGAEPVTATLWSAVSLDATRVEEGAAASDIAGLSLWPQPQSLPGRLRFLWEGLHAELLVAKQDWDVWTDWYEARLRGDPVMENLEIARATIRDEIWNQGPAVVNAEIRRLIEEIELPITGGDRADFRGLVGSGDISSPDEQRSSTDILANLPEVPLGNKWIVSGNRLVIDPRGQETDDAAARDPVVCQLHEAVKRKARAFATAEAGIDERLGWRDSMALSSVFLLP
jgi:hypothetical protein